MAFDVFWEPRALEALRKLPKHIAKRIVLKVDAAKENPKRYLERLVDEDFYKLRVGDYRLFIDVSFGRNLLAVRSIKHRSVAYGR